tara:strand:+ start:4995 stop:6938 length:1944 start_codon:yes stop_codon:yes gene_type:complete
MPSLERILIILIQSGFLFSQHSTENFICKNEQVVSKWLTSQSSLTQNQEKIDITYYGISIEIDIDLQQIFASVKVNGILSSDQPDSIELDLNSQLMVDSVISNDEQISFVHQDNMIKIPSQASLVEENNFSMEIYYNGHPPSTGFGSFNFDEHLGVDHIWTLSEPYGSRDWWPCKDDPSDKADSLDIKIIVPSEQIAVSNGILVEELELENGRKQYHWFEKYPICTYLVSITTYPYTKWEDIYIGMNGDTLPLEYYVYPDHYDIVLENYLLTKDMISVFAEKFGEYPFMGEKYGHVEFARGGGMEHQTISSLGGYSQWLIAHELGHQWWGDLITCASFHHIWLNEGFARFSEALWDEATGGFNAYKNYWQNHTYYGGGTIFVEEPNLPSQIFNGNLTYNKAGWVMHMLRGVMGDSIFFETLQSYSSNDSLAYSSATTEDFKAVCESVSNYDLDDFFEQWIYGEYYPRYSLSWEVSNMNELIINIEQTQNWQYFHMPIEIKVFLPVDTLSFKVDNQFQFEQYNLGAISGYPSAVLLDPDNWILKEVEYMNLSDIIPNKPQITIFPAYPNPFNPSTFLKFFIPQALGEISPKVNIFDIKGQRIEEILVDKVSPGMHEIQWNANGRGSGIYFIQFFSDNTIFSQKIQLIK